MASRSSGRLTAFLTLIAREAWSVKMLVPAALVLGCFAPLTALFAGAGGFDAEAVRDLTSATSALVFGALAFAILGYSSLAPEVASGGLAFYLSRPISAGALWFSKWIARSFVATLSILAVLLPSLLLDGRPMEALRLIYDPPKVSWHLWHPPWHWQAESLYPYFPWGTSRQVGMDLPLEIFVILGGLLIYVVAHFVGCALRLRGIWTAVDIGAAGSLALILVSTFGRYGALGAQVGGVLLLGLLLTLILLLGLLSGWAQIRWGGISPRRSHGVLSILVWGVLGAALLTLNLDARRLESQPLEAFDYLIDVLPAERGSWALMTGMDKETGAAVTFLVDTESEVRRRLGTRLAFTTRPRFSANGEHLFFWQCEKTAPRGRTEASCFFHHLDLRDPALLKKVIPLDFEELRSHRMALAPDGSKFAIIHGRTSIVVDTRGRELWRSTLPRRDWLMHEFERSYFKESGELIVIRSCADRREASVNEFYGEIWSHGPGREPELLRKVPWPLHQGLRLEEDARLEANTEVLLAFDGSLGDLVRVESGAKPPAGGGLASACEEIMELEARGAEVKAALWASEPEEATDPCPTLLRLNPTLLMPGLLEKLNREYDHDGWSYVVAQPDRERLLAGFIRSSLPSPIPWKWLFGTRAEERRTAVVDIEKGIVVREIDGFAAMPIPRRPGDLGAEWLLDKDNFPFRLDLETGHLEPVLER